jgi:hypothetical protein
VEPLEAILYYDLGTRDGRSAIEVKAVAVLGDGALYVSPKGTVYSCAYDSQAGRIAAFGRVVNFCTQANVRVLAFENGKGRRASWQ